VVSAGSETLAEHVIILVSAGSETLAEHVIIRENSGSQLADPVPGFVRIQTRYPQPLIEE
jgi:hypothetical protein